LEGRADLLGVPVGVARPEQGGEGAGLRGRGGSASEGTRTPSTGKRHRRYQVGFGHAVLGTARTVWQSPAGRIDGPNRDDFATIAGERNTSFRPGVAQAAAENDQVKLA